MLTLEFWDEPHPGRCRCCGRPMFAAGGAASDGGRPMAVYRAEWTDHPGEACVNLCVVIGYRWAESGPSGNVGVFLLLLDCDGGDIGATLVAQDESGWEGPIMGHAPLTPDAARAHARYPDVLRLVDAIVDRDERVTGALRTS